ncbi:hypothetical protein [Rhizobium sp. NXC24]|uniref:hypothetical protein n=1 Tax=Rhizobium sp. NXC24 TaxID=2048897 RepID=UPI0026AF6F7E
MATVIGKKQTPNPAERNLGRFIAYYEKAIALDAFDLDPIADATRAIRPLAMLDDAFPSMSTRYGISLSASASISSENLMTAEVSLRRPSNRFRHSVSYNFVKSCPSK